MRRFLLSCLLLVQTAYADIFNPITDVCWKCFFPIYISGKNLTTGYEEFSEHDDSLFCGCSLTHWGVPISFWEPMMIMEVTQTPYKLVCLGGKELPFAKTTYKNHGALSQSTDAGRTSFYNVHYYPVPLARLLGLFPGFSCLKKHADYLFPPPWMSEIDPTWRNPKLARIFSLDMQAYATMEAQEACIEDCIASTKRRPNNKTFWCAGCQGSLYPLVGHVAHHVSGIQASSLLVHRMLVRHHFLRSVVGLGTGFEKDNFCKQTVFHHLQKTHYKTQLLLPVPDMGSSDSKIHCRPLGASTAPWECKKSYPGGGEDFAYIVWTQMQCCYPDWKDVVKKLVPGAKAVVEVIEAIEDL